MVISAYWLPTPCIEWQRARSVGYGNLWANGVQWYAHRKAVHDLIHRIPYGLMVLHKCDNRPCYNVKHLYLGDHAANFDDAVARGRWRRPTSEQSAKLSPDTVRAIRELVASGHSQNAVARRFGIRSSTVNRIVLRRTWRQLI